MNAYDKELFEREARGWPIRVGLVGAGNLGRMIALQLLTPAPGIRLVAIANRTVDKAATAFGESGGIVPVRVSTSGELEAAIDSGKPAITSNPDVLSHSESIDVIVEATGTVEYAAQVTIEAIEHGKHVVLANAELDSTLGPILQVKARRAGVVLTNIDGDEPGVAMNLYRYLKAIGLKPVAAGNLKGMVDPYRTPETQAGFSRDHGQNPAIMTSFADGTKLAMEAAVLANATGFRVGRRGMHGPRCGNVREMAALLPADQLLQTGLVDYALGAEPGSGAFVIVHEENPSKRRHLKYLKMGDGPFHVFCTPYHLPHIQIVSTIARAVLNHDATVAPVGAPVCEVIAIAKTDLRAGTVLDGVGGFHGFGLIENSDMARREDLLPIGLAQGARLKRDLAKDSPISLGDVELPDGRLCDRLYQEQITHFAAGHPCWRVDELVTMTGACV